MIDQFIFFPFTHITQKQIHTLLSFFPAFYFFPASADFKHNSKLQKLFEQGRIIPFFSSKNDLKLIDLKLRQYLEWAGLHKSARLPLKSFFKKTPYFTSDSDVTALKSRIKGEKKDSLTSEAESVKASVRQRHLLFLKMAQLCDEQNEQIDLALKNIETGQDKLISNLRGVNDDLKEVLDQNTDDIKDSGIMMIRERMQAWSESMAGQLVCPGTQFPLFVTTSEAVFSYLESICKDVVNALDIDKIKVHENECENRKQWQHQFCEYLVQAVQAGGSRKNELPKINDRCSFWGQIKLKLFSGDDINQLFNCSDKKIPVCLIKLK